jgi:hypothetical protein
MARLARAKSSNVSSKSRATFSEQARDLTASRDVVVDAAAVSATLWFSYILLLLYLLIAVGGVTHRNILFEDPVKLPFLNVDLPLVGFFVLGPGLLLIARTYVLLHFVLFAAKVEVFHTELQAQIPDEEVRAQLRWQLPSNIFVQVLAGTREIRRGVIGLMLWLIATISLVFGPVAVLVLFQIQFLPYHPSAPIALWLRLTVLLDVILLWLFWPSVAHGKVALIGRQDLYSIAVLPMAAVKLFEPLVWWRPLDTTVQRATPSVWDASRRGAFIAAAIASLIPIVLVFAISTYPGEWANDQISVTPVLRTIHDLLFAGEPNEITGRPKSWFSNRLVLTDQTLVDLDKIDKIATSHAFRGRDLRQAVFNRSDLRKADFTGAILGPVLN